MLRSRAKRPSAAALTTLVLAALSLWLVLLFAIVRAAPAASSGAQRPTVVLVHGAWADASSWSRVIARLQQDGYRVVAPANPLRSLQGDTAYLQSILAQRTGPFVLVGHSYGGAVVTNAAAADPDVRALVYVNGFVPDIGEDVLHLTGEESLVPNSIEVLGYPPHGATDVDVYIKHESFRGTLAGDLSPKRADILAAAQRPISLAALSAPTAAAGWRTIPSWYLLGTEDRAITPTAQRSMARRAGAHVTPVKASHLSPIARPKEVVKVIEKAAVATTPK